MGDSVHFSLEEALLGLNGTSVFLRTIPSAAGVHCTPEVRRPGGSSLPGG